MLRSPPGANFLHSEAHSAERSVEALQQQLVDIFGHEDINVQEGHELKRQSPQPQLGGRCRHPGRPTVKEPATVKLWLWALKQPTTVRRCRCAPDRRNERGERVRAVEATRAQRRLQTHSGAAAIPVVDDDMHRARATDAQELPPETARRSGILLTRDEGHECPLVAAGPGASKHCCVRELSHWLPLHMRNQRSEPVKASQKLVGQHGALLRTADMLSSSTLTLRPLPRAGVHCCRRLSTAAGIRCSRLSTAASASASAPASAATAAAAAAPRSARVQALDRLAEGMARPMSEMEIASGSGSYLASATGERYLDFTSGIGVTNTGHCHPKVVAAAQHQMGLLLHGQQSVGLSSPLVALTNRMLDGVVPASHDRLMFSTTGAEAVENAMSNPNTHPKAPKPHPHPHLHPRPRPNPNPKLKPKPKPKPKPEPKPKPKPDPDQVENAMRLTLALALSLPLPLPLTLALTLPQP